MTTHSLYGYFVTLHILFAMQLLEQQCLKTEQCVAFNSRGEFKSHLQPRERWKETTAGEGLYVAGVYLCIICMCAIRACIITTLWYMCVCGSENEIAMYMFVVDIDMCLSDLHNCDRNADCIHAGEYSHLHQSLSLNL